MTCKKLPHAIRPLSPKCPPKAIFKFDKLTLSIGGLWPSVVKPCCGCLIVHSVVLLPFRSLNSSDLFIYHLDNNSKMARVNGSKINGSLCMEYLWVQSFYQSFRLIKWQPAWLRTILQHWIPLRKSLILCLRKTDFQCWLCFLWHVFGADYGSCLLD